MRKRKYGHTRKLSADSLAHAFASLPYIKTALLFGSRSIGKANTRSDYDFALEMENVTDGGWGMQAKAWIDLCNLLGLKEYDIDVVDLASADTFLKQNISQNYILLKGDEDDIPRLLG
jgi:predicted nucleotidyltransferase